MALNIIGKYSCLGCNIGIDPIFLSGLGLVVLIVAFWHLVLEENIKASLLIFFLGFLMVSMYFIC